MLKRIRNISLFPIVILFASCQYFHTEKIDSEEFFEEEIQAIDWQTVDQYPLFEACDGMTEKEEQFICFNRTISQGLLNAVDSQLPATATSIKDTIFVYLSVNEKAELVIRELDISPTIQNYVPKIDSLLIGAVSNMELVAPAYKRGIPVKSEFKLPLVIISKEL